MQKWFVAIDALINAGPTTVMQFGERMNLRYKTAWLLKYKIEQALKNEFDREIILQIAAMMRTSCYAVEELDV